MKQIDQDKIKKSRIIEPEFQAILQLYEARIDSHITQKELSKMFKNWKKEIVNSFIRFGDKRLTNGEKIYLDIYVDGLKKETRELSNPSGRQEISFTLSAAGLFSTKQRETETAFAIK